MKNESCLKSAIWSPKIQENKELKKNLARLNELKKILCESDDFWHAVRLIEELLRPLKSSILAIEGSVVDARIAYKSIESSFREAGEVAVKFSKDQIGAIKQV